MSIYTQSSPNASPPPDFPHYAECLQYLADGWLIVPNPEHHPKPLPPPTDDINTVVQWWAQGYKSFVVREKPEQPAPGIHDFVTVVTAKNGERLTKLIYKAGEEGLKTLAYDRAREFLYEQRPFTGLTELATIFRGLNYTQAIIPGWLVDGLDPKLPHCRLVHPQDDGRQPTLRDVAHYWLAVDGDNLPAFDGLPYDPFVDPNRAARQLRGSLPEPFHSAECLWQQSASAATKRDAAGNRTINMKLFFLLSRALTTAQMKLWLEPWLKERDDKRFKTHGDKGIFDGAMYQRERLIYVAETRVTLDAIDECRMTEDQWMGMLPGGVVQVPAENAERLVIKGKQKVSEKVFFERTLAKKDQTPVAMPKIDETLAQVKATRPRSDWYQIVSALRNVTVEGFDADQSYHLMIERAARFMTNELYTGKNAVTAEELNELKGEYREDWERVFEHGAVTNYGFGTLAHFADLDNPDRNQVEVELPAAMITGGVVASTITTEPGSDDYVALIFTRDHYNHLRYVEQWGWMHFDGRRWVRVKEYVIWELIKPIAREASKMTDTTATARSVLSKSHIAGGESLARGSMAASPDMFDVDPYLLNTPGGVVDLRTGQRHDADPRYLCTKMTAAAPSGGRWWEAAPTLHRVLAEWTGGDEQMMLYLQRLVGAAAIGQIRHHLWIYIWGEGGNGKGTFLDLIVWLFGDYAVTLPSDALMASKQHRHLSELTPLKGARLAVAQEVPDGAWDETRIKLLTGGGKLSANYMRQDPFTFDQTHTLMIGGNGRPNLRRVDNAEKRRLRLIPFFKVFDGPDAQGTADPDLPEKLKAEGEGIMQWVIDGAVAYLEEGLPEVEAIKRETDAYLHEQDHVSRWIDEFCRIGEDRKDKGLGLFQAYSRWTDAAKQGGMQQRRFYDELEKRGFRRATIKGSNMFHGLELRPVTFFNGVLEVLPGLDER